MDHPVETSVVFILTLLGRQVHPARRMVWIGDDRLFNLLTTGSDYSRVFISL